MYLPSEELQAEADSRTKKAILTKRKGKTIESNSTTGKTARRLTRRVATVDPLAEELVVLMVTLLIPVVEM